MDTPRIGIDILRRLKAHVHTKAKLTAEAEALTDKEEARAEQQRQLDTKVEAWSARNNAAEAEESALKEAFTGTGIDMDDFGDMLWFDEKPVMTDDELNEALAQYIAENDDEGGEE
jgi:uncharacterized protein YqfA (UPF0365 family)